MKVAYRISGLVLTLLFGADSFGAGGELGNAFIPFDSKIGEYTLEYPKGWRVIDLSTTTNFSDGEKSFLAVSAGAGNGPNSKEELVESLEKRFPGVIWKEVKLSGLEGLEGQVEGVRTVMFLRSPGDLLTLRFRSGNGPRSDKLLTYMLQSFRAD